MPYIKKEYRPRLDPHIEALAKEINKINEETSEGHAFAGLLDYSCTRLAFKTLPEQRYWAYTLVEGVFNGLAKEFYRRVVAPYEDKQMKKRGDIYK
ncbi:hypothetical protein HYW35_01515 [Candidatus Saccharibacteria bacterium]|nr:hypothetical protein [Candidatus Saccharibacteria bacterium]